MLIRKLFRTAWKYRSQFISMIIMIAIGVGVFLGFNIEWKSIVKKASGTSRYEKIVTMIEESEKLKSSVESKAEKLAEKKVIIGSYHFVFDDEGCQFREEYQERFENLPREYSHLYMAIEGVLAAVICIEDPLRPESTHVIQALRDAGFKKIVMMTGDSKRTAKAVAEKIGVDEFYFEVLPEDKAKYVEQEKALGRKVLMVGDGVNDSPALSAADAGIAISDGAELAREIADITIVADDLYQLVKLKKLSNALMKRINSNYKKIVGINTALILLGVGGIVQPTTSAMLHNVSTLTISLQGMQDLLKDS